MQHSVELDDCATSVETALVGERRHTGRVTTTNSVIGGDPESESCCMGDAHATHASTDRNPLHFPLMAHPEPMLERSRSFNDDLAWVRVAQDYAIAPPPTPPSSGVSC